MTRWFRWYEGTTEDGKFRVTARNAGVTVRDVIALWAFMLEDASKDEHRGVCARNEDFMAAILDFDDGVVEKILAAMEEVGMASVGPAGWVIHNWDKFDPKARADRPGASEWIRIRAGIFARDDYTCLYCGERGGRLECDHIFPVAKGGSHDDENLATSCFSCNRSKRDKTVEEWLQ